MKLSVSELPAWLNFELWEEFEQHRRELQKPMTVTATRRAFKKIERMSIEDNCNPNDIIEQTIENGWMGFFNLKNRPAQTQKPACSATTEARRLQNEGFRTGFEDEASDRTAIPQNVIDIREQVDERLRIH